MGRRSVGRYQNGSGQSYQEDLPERGPGALAISLRKKRHVDAIRLSLWFENCMKRVCNDDDVSSRVV